jgi:hypothetical protein
MTTAGEARAGLRSALWLPHSAEEAEDLQPVS